MGTYTPPVTPNVNLNFNDATPYTPDLTPNVILPFSDAVNFAQQANWFFFFPVLDGSQ